MKFSTNVKPISFLEGHAAEIAEDLERSGSPMIITQNGEARMVIEDIRDYERKEEALALLKILAMGRKDIQEGRGMSAEEFRRILSEQ